MRDQLSTPAIARLVGICNHTVYKVLKDHPWFPPKKRATRGADWTSEHDRQLRALWPAGSKDELIAALPGHTWMGIQRRASFLKVKRLWLRERQPNRALSPLMRQLRTIRREQGLNRAQVSERIGYHHNMILGWENGKTQPKMQHVVDLAGALGYEVCLQPKGQTAAAVADSEIPWPSRARLMAGRA